MNRSSVVDPSISWPAATLIPEAPVAAVSVPHRSDWYVAPIPTTSSRAIRFDAAVIDPDLKRMQDAYRLRYQVYCVEREFLPAADYPLELEIDNFDRDSIHVGAVDSRGHLAGTARLVLPVGGLLPTMDKCAFSPIDQPVWGPRRRWVEASRLSVSRSYRAVDPDTGLKSDQRGPIFLTVLRALYIASKDVGATHWLVSIERSLQRLLSRHGFPFRQLGPEFDYLGPVAPYSLDLEEFEQIVRRSQFPQLVDFASAVATRPARNERPYPTIPGSVAALVRG